MKPFQTVLVALVLLAAAPAALAQTADTPENRLAAAGRYAATFDFSEMLTQSFQAVAQSLPPDQRDEFIRQASAMFDFDELTEFMKKTMAATFTVGELDKLADFYGTPEGKSIARKMPQMMSIVAPYMQQQTIKAIQRYMEEIKKKRAGPDKS